MKASALESSDYSHQSRCLLSTQLPIQALKGEIRLYRQLASTVTPEIDAACFWNKVAFGTRFYKLFVFASSFLVSSASLERGHAVLRDRFEGGKEHAHDDYKEASVMCRYNSVKRSDST